MAIQASGFISLANVQTEFGGANPISLSEYYRGSVNDYSKYIYAYDTSNNAINNVTVPSIGQVSLSNYYGTGRVFQYTISGSMQELNITSSWLTSVGWNGVMPVLITNIAWLWSNSTSTAGLTISYPITLENYGKIIGKGGNGGNGGNSYTSGGAGGPAINNTVSGTVIINNANAYIAGGGGGGGGSGNAEGVGYANHGSSGGGGAGGGNGGSCGYIGAGGAGGAIGQAGANGATRNNEPFLIAAIGGGAGGGGGMQWDYFEGAGAGGGRILPGTGGSGAYRDVVYPLGGAGGSAGSTGGAGRSIWVHAGGGGGGGWGANGGSGGRYSPAGGAGGAAISGTATTRTNNGTIYGSVV